MLRVAGQQKKEKGQILILCYVILAALLVFTAPLLSKILNEGRLVDRQRLKAEVLYFAEGGAENAINQLLYAIANFQVEPNIARYPASGVLTVTYANSSNFPTGATVSAVIEETAGGQYTSTDPDGTNVFVKPYKVSATCIHPLDSSITVTVHQVFALRRIYAFQHAVFYNDDLEILPGPNMTFTGRIHSNKDIYLNSDGNTLTIDSEYLHSAANIYNRPKDGRTMGGSVDIQKAGTGSFFEMDGLDSSSTDWLTESQTRWNGTVKSSVHGITKLATPVVGSIQPDGYYATNANIKIENGAIRQGGTLLVEGVDIPVGTIVTDNDFYNNREGKYIKMTNIDLKKLAGYATGDPEGSPSKPNHLPSNGLAYVTRTDTSGSEEPGVRLINGSQIYRSSGLTVVSNDPMYIQGDYNTVDKKPASVVCDSINLLSNNWNDSNSAAGLNTRTASATTVNTAFIAGVDNTTTGHYNGGLENYPRLHEAWSGKNLYITGAFIELWSTQIAQGAWAYGGTQYTAPGRKWYYDTSFASGSMPPFTPWAVEARKGAWWKE